eukprot:308437-Ditylum_brightwellii.AAC.1
MNHRSEIHGGYKHRPKFHRFGTDDPLMDEKVNLANGAGNGLTNGNNATVMTCQLMEITPIADNDICHFINI